MKGINQERHDTERSPGTPRKYGARKEMSRVRAGPGEVRGLPSSETSRERRIRVGLNYQIE